MSWCQCQSVCPLLPLASLTHPGGVSLQHIHSFCNLKVLLQPAATARLHKHPYTWLQTSYSLSLPGIVSLPLFPQFSNIPRIVLPRAGQHHHKCSKIAADLRTIAGIIFPPFFFYPKFSPSISWRASGAVRCEMVQMSRSLFKKKTFKFLWVSFTCLIFIKSLLNISWQEILIAVCL